MSRKKHKPSKRVGVFVPDKDVNYVDPFDSGVCRECKWRTENNRCMAYTNEGDTLWSRRVAYCRAILDCKKYTHIDEDFTETKRPYTKRVNKKRKGELMKEREARREEIFGSTTEESKEVTEK